MKKLLVTDFDRTLYVNSRIPERNREAVQKWRADGNLFVVATGREKTVLRGLLQENAVKADYLICNNGATIVSWEGKRLFQKTMAADTSWHITESLIKVYGISVDVTLTEGRIQVNKHELKEEKNLLYPGVNHACSLDMFHNLCHQVLQIHIRFPERDRTREAAEAIGRLYTKATAFANEKNLDIVAEGVDKAEAVSFLLKQLHWTGRISVIGDSFNDVGMIRRFSGYAVAAASEEIKRQAEASFESVAECIDFLRNRTDL